MIAITAERVRLLRDHTGRGMGECRRAMEMASRTEFGGDVVLAIAYIEVNSRAIAVKGDRHAYMLRCAGPEAERLRGLYPALDAAFPRSGGDTVAAPITSPNSGSEPA
jgi:hypothetical protein